MVTETQQQPSTCWLVTGANRGIGLEYVQQLLSDKSNRVAAGFRSHSGDLEALQQEAQDRLLLVKVDVSDEDTSKVRLGGSAVYRVARCCETFGPNFCVHRLLLRRSIELLVN